MSENYSAGEREGRGQATAIEKYFKLVKLDKSYSDFLPTLIKCSEKYDLSSLTFGELEKIGDAVLNLAWLLYKCEDLERKYEKSNINHTVFVDTISDIRIWADTYHSFTKGKFGIAEMSWLLNHIEFRIFRLGRLQFAFDKAEVDCPEKRFVKNDNAIAVHIPEGEPLTPELCRASFEYAEKFFAEYFPEYKYKFYTCHSWFLDSNLKKIMKKDSNILRFAELFDVISSEESYAAIRYIFGWLETKDSVIKNDYPGNTLKKRIKDHLLSGGILEEGYGIIKH